MSGKGNYDMTVYIALLVWTILCSPLENTKMTCKNMTIISGKTLYLLVTFIPIWFIMAFRGLGVGTDTLANASYFVSAATSPSLSYLVSDGIWNAGISIISYMIGLISTDIEVYMIWSSIIISIGFAIFIYRTSNKVWLSTFLFLTLNLFFISLNTSRQFIAISIAINAFVFLYHNRHSGVGWILFLLAAWIHTSIFSFIPALIGIWLVKQYQSYIKLYFITIVFAILFVISLMSIATIFSSFFPHYAIYTGGTSQDNLIENTGGGKIIVEYLMFLFIIIIYFIKQKICNCKVNNTIMDSFIPGAIFCIVIGLSFATNTMMNRVALPYQCLFLSLIPYTCTMMQQKIRYIFMGIMMIGLVGYYYLWAQGNLGNIVPYYMWI